MKLLIQRVKKAQVTIEGNIHNTIGEGILAFFAAHIEDSPDTTIWLAEKLVTLRIFSDTEGKMNLSVQDIGGEILVISQFTIYGTCNKGRRPEFTRSAPPREAEHMYEKFIGELSDAMKQPVKSGIFGAHMEIELINDGPVTFEIERF